MLRFDKQPSFELGVIAFEMCAGCHPIDAYLTAGKNMRGYTAADLAELPDVYPADFNALLRSLVAFYPGESTALCLCSCVMVCVCVCVCLCVCAVCCLLVALSVG